MDRDLLTALGISLALTLVLETGFFLLTVKWNKNDLLLVILVNVVTNPVVVLLYWLAARYTGWNTVVVKIPLEVFAILTEGTYYRKYGRSFRQPYLFSVAANIFSFTAGIIIQRFYRRA